MSWANLRSARLGNDFVALRPLAATDRPALAAIVFDPEIWRYFVQRVATAADLDAFLDAALNDTAAGRRVVYAVIDKVSGELAGSMAYGNLAETEKRLEIGWSWLGAPFRGRGLNRWAKLVLLEHAFERLGCERIEFKTDQLNLQARKGLRNIGATEEGVLRSYNCMPDGRRRDAVYYSILKKEWPIVRTGLLELGKLPAPASEMPVLGPQ
jgi:RimJ/RimL family protein N-acetyltransferase